MNKNKIWIVAVIAIIMSFGLILMGCDFFGTNCHGEKACIHSGNVLGETVDYSSCRYLLCNVFNSAGDKVYYGGAVRCDCE